MKIPKRAIIGLTIVLALVGSGLAASEGFVASFSSSSSGIQHVVLIMMENMNYQYIIGCSCAPYINSLANNYALATNYYGIEYPSLPNYIDISSGSNGGITTDCTSGPTSSGGCETSQSTIFNLLSNHGLTWKAYMESMPSNCYKSDSGDYIVHHNPVPYETAVTTCGTNDVPMGSTSVGSFYDDVKNGNLPNFAFITPNGCDDMHNTCGASSYTGKIQQGDSYLSKLIPLIQSSPQYGNTIIIITWDTGDCFTSGCTETTNGGGHVVTLIIGPPSLVNYGKFGTFYNHYSTLATIEDIFHLGNLGRNDATATPMTDIVNINAAVSSSSSSTSSSSSSTSSNTSTITTSNSTSSISTSNSTSETTTNSSTSSSSSTIESSTATSTASSSTSASTTYSSESSSESSSSSSMTSSSSSSLLATSANSSTLSLSIQENNGQGLTTNNSTSSSGSVSSLYQSAAGFLASLSSAKDPPAAYGFATYELFLLGALGYVLIGIRRTPKYFWLP